VIQRRNDDEVGPANVGDVNVRLDGKQSIIKQNLPGNARQLDLKHRLLMPATPVLICTRKDLVRTDDTAKVIAFSARDEDRKMFHRFYFQQR
jgi:hypothetical protein